MKNIILFLFFLGCNISNASEKDVKRVSVEAQVNNWKAFILKAAALDFTLKKDEVIKLLGEPAADQITDDEIQYTYDGDPPKTGRVTAAVLLTFEEGGKGRLMSISAGGYRDYSGESDSED